MHIQRVFPVLILTCLCACTSGLKLVNIDGEIPHGPDVGGMHGVENLTFDGAGALFVTGLDGMIYRVEPTNDPFRGTITARKKLGVGNVNGIEVGPDGLVYVGVKDEKGVSRIGKIDKDLNHITYLTEHIPGLNGFEQSQAISITPPLMEGISARRVRSKSIASGSARMKISSTPKLLVWTRPAW